MIAQGTLIKLRAYGDEVITRRVVRDNGNVVAVCTDEEYQAALTQKREPVAVGFNKKYIVGEQNIGGGGIGQAERPNRRSVN